MEGIISSEVIVSKIYLIRNCKVMFDKDLAELYGVETKQLKRQVRRNISRFPKDFMFELTKEELLNWRSQFGTSNSEAMGMRYLPFVFTEQGVAMLSSILNSEQAIAVNIQIMRIFTGTRNLLNQSNELRFRIEKVENSLEGQSYEIKVLFEYLKKLMSETEDKSKQNNRKKIGFKK